ncbi:hypothetical protein GDO81_020035 [Engystomops pustulosus]|uniref:Uncharacterized protein n=1 Tax=Engystomops pustulosus TaxID=76066 RepID=A0AAV6ZF75_ENGPU|nr:hypothetical protein GDO81_020035 [Engystomops pustulosus]
MISTCSQLCYHQHTEGSKVASTTSNSRVYPPKRCEDILQHGSHDDALHGRRGGFIIVSSRGFFFPHIIFLYFFFADTTDTDPSQSSVAVY